MTTQTTSNLDQFIIAYADAVVSPELPDEEWQAAVKTAQEIRKLNWKGERMPLAEAAEIYAHIVGGYNNFEGDMLADLHSQFPNSGITVTPARESSVAVYLHVTGELGKQVKRYIDKYWHADEVEWNDNDTLHVWWD